MISDLSGRERLSHLIVREAAKGDLGADYQYGTPANMKLPPEANWQFWFNDDVA